MLVHRSPIDAVEGGGAVLTRAALNSAPRAAVYEARNPTKAQVYVLEWPIGSSQRVVVKDVKQCVWPVRAVLGPFLLDREWRALQALEGIDGVPRAIARPDRHCFVMSFCPGRPVMELKHVGVDQSVLEAVEKLLQEAHSRGVTHGDLHRSNILVDEDNAVTVVDWATACVYGAQPGGLRGIMFREWQGLDVRALAKLKARHAPELLTDAELWTLEHGGTAIYRAIRQSGYFLRRLTGHKKAKSTSQSRERYTRLAAKGQEKRAAQKSKSPLRPEESEVGG